MSENRVTAQQKKSVVKRANGCCEYCRSQERFAIQAFSAEHIMKLCKNRSLFQLESPPIVK
jgi:hypothetical protein